MRIEEARFRLTLIEIEMSVAESIVCALSGNPPEEIVGDRNVEEDDFGDEEGDWMSIYVKCLLYNIIYYYDLIFKEI
jgi:hypothetical protein